MDYNDVELTATRSHRDNDEVYPLDELSEETEFDIYRPTARRQNRYFTLGVVALMITVGILYAAKIYQREDVELQSNAHVQGTVNNNEQNSKSDALRDHTNQHFKKPHSSGYQGGQSGNGDETQPPQEQEEEEEAAAAAAGNPEDESPQTPPPPKVDEKEVEVNPETESPQTPPPQVEEEAAAAAAVGNPGDESPQTPPPKVEEEEDAGNQETESPQTTPPPKVVEEEQEQQAEKPAETTKPDDPLKAWHAIKISRQDGQMYEVVDVLSHDPQSFTEGLTFFNDKLYESVGLNQQSAVLRLDPNTGETLETHVMDGKYFAEGLAYCHGKLYQLTYKAKKGFIYDANDLSHPPEEFDFETTTGEGWGFTYDEKRDEFIVSDGSEYLHFWDRHLKFKRKHQVMRLNGLPAHNINELEFWRDRVVANVWFEQVLIIINPVSGLVEKEYDFSTIWSAAGVEQNRKAEVFNGISISKDPDILYVTGKWWSKMFKIKLLPEIPS